MCWAKMLALSKLKPQVKKFKYLGIFLTTEGVMQCEIIRWTDAESVVKQLL